MHEQVNIAEWLVDRIADRYPEHNAVVEHGRSINYNELRQFISRVARLVSELGCSKGQRVVICLPNSRDFIAAFLGTIRAGAIAVPISTDITMHDLSRIVDDTDPRIIITNRSAWRRLNTGVDTGAVNWLLTDEKSGDWERELANTPSSPQRPSGLGDDLAFFLYTSGSTGQKKAVAHTHRSMLAASVNVAQGALRLLPGDRVLSVSKLCYAHGLGGGMYFPFSVGASTILIQDPPELESIAELITRHRPTVLCGLPTFYARLLDAVNRWMRVDLACIRLATSGGEPLPRYLFEEYKRRFSIELLDGLGSTETLARVISNRPQMARAGSCGTPIDSYEIRLTGDDGETAATGTSGSLSVRCGSAFSGYWDCNGLAERRHPGDWLFMGDIMTADEEGYYYCRGRDDLRFKIAGKWVSPEEIEVVVGEILGVERAVVAGIEDRWGRRRLVAYVEADRRPDVEIGTIFSYCKMRLPVHMIPSDFIFLSKFPEIGVGKLDRRALPLPEWAQRRESNL